MVPAGNKAKRLSSASYTTKTIHHHHHHPQEKFSRKSGCRAQLDIGFSHHAEILKKLMIQFQENAPNDGRMDRMTDRRTHRLYHRGSKNTLDISIKIQ